MKECCCAISCPVSGCEASLNSLQVFSHLGHCVDTSCGKNTQLRYRTIINDLVAYNNKNLKLLTSSIIDIMTLKCPVCKISVDPLPDACSAVMCLTCGNHYCNYCFESFASGQIHQDRAAAHRHTATHNNSNRLEDRDAFLPVDVIERGHKQYRLAQLVKCVSVAMASADYGENSCHDVALSLIMCFQEITDVGLDPLVIWTQAQEKLQTKCSVVEAETDDPMSFEDVPQMFRAVGDDEVEESIISNLDDDNVLIVRGRASMSPPEALSHHSPRPQVFASAPLPPPPKRGGPQLANAILTSNSHAINQIIVSYKDELDIDYVDQRHGHPLASLSILSGPFIDSFDSQVVNIVLESGQTWVAKLLLSKGANPLKVNKGGRTVLYIAIEAGLLELVELILGKYPQIDIDEPTTEELVSVLHFSSPLLISLISQQRYSPIHVAARNNHGLIIRYLVDMGADIDLEESEHGYTPLMLALVLGHEWSAAELVLAGANVRYLASNGRSPMFVAAEKGLASIVALMVSVSGIDINEAAVRPSGLRMIHVASFHKQPIIVSQLIKMGANVNQFDDENGYSPLAMSILGMNTPAALELIDAGADISQASRSGRMPLYVAIEKGLTDVVTAIASRPGVDINASVTLEKNAARPLHVAILYGQPHLIPVLIRLGANVNLPDDERKCSPLLMATLLKDVWSVKLLLRAGASAFQQSKEGRSPLYIAAEKGFSSILQLLVDEGSEGNPLMMINSPVTSESHRGVALHIAAMFDNAHTVLELFTLGADINVMDAFGRKPVCR